MKQTSETDSSPTSANNGLDLIDSEFEALFLKEFPAEANNLTVNGSVFDAIKAKRDIFVSFNSKSNSNNIKRGKRQYDCTYEGCSKRYKSKENLNLHIKNKHKGIKPYKCSTCCLAFSHRNGKRYHERITHTKYLPYKCSLCSQEFATISSMKVHKKISHKSKEENKAN